MNQTEPKMPSWFLDLPLDLKIISVGFHLDVEGIRACKSTGEVCIESLDMGKKAKKKCIKYPFVRLLIHLSIH